MFDLSGRTALVTGAGQGVGQGIAATLAAHGAKVAVNDYFADRAQAATDAICAGGGVAAVVPADVTELDSMREAVTVAENELGPIDILVNNAGNAGPEHGLHDPTPFWETGPADWQPWMGTNFYGVLNSSRAVLPGMVTRGYGRIVSIISDAGRVGEPNLVVYSGAKAGAAGFTRALAKAVGRHGITANCVALSTIRTPATEEVLADEALAKRALRPYIIRRFGEPEDVAAAILYLVSDEASWVTAQTHSVNGGYARLGLMRAVNIIGVGITKFGKAEVPSLRALGSSAIADAINDAGLAASDIELVVHGSAMAGLMSGQEMIRGQVVTADSELTGAALVNVENACATSSTGLHVALCAIRSGEYDHGRCLRH